MTTSTPEALDERTFITLLNSLIDPLSNLRWHIKICERVENKGVGFISQQVMDAILEYSKIPVTIQSYAKSQSYAKVTGTPSDPKDTRSARCRAVVSATSSTSDEVASLKTNDDGNFKLDGNFYPLKAFVTEEIYLGKLSKVFRGVRREKRWGYHPSQMIRTRTGGRIKTTAET